MKNFILRTLLVGLFSLHAMAYQSRFEILPESICPEKEINFEKLTAHCRAENASQIIKAKVSKQLTTDEKKLLNFEILGAVELEIVPDADSNDAYFYTRWLVDSHSNKVVIITIQGWYNTEMDESAKFVSRYNLKGQLVNITEIQKL
jgi:hypothetical protein